MEIDHPLTGYKSGSNKKGKYNAKQGRGTRIKWIKIWSNLDIDCLSIDYTTELNTKRRSIGRAYRMVEGTG